MSRLLPALVAAVALFVAAPALATGGSIAGTVSGSHGPENDAWVILEKNGAYLISTWTHSDGFYGFGDLDAGPYNLRVYPTDALRIEALPVTLADGEQRTLDVTVSAGASISGTVRNTLGVPVAGTQVLAQTPGELGNHGTLSAADGTYTISGLTAGTYRMTVLPPVGTPYGGQDRGFVDVTDGQTTSGVDITLTSTPIVLPPPPSPYQDPYKDPYHDPYKDPYKDPCHKPPHGHDPYKDPYKDPRKNPCHKPPQNPYKDPAKHPRGHVRLTNRRLHVSRPGTVAHLSCAKHNDCVGTVALRSAGATLGRAQFRVVAGHERKVQIALSRHARRMLARHHGALRARLFVFGRQVMTNRWHVKLTRN